MKLTHSVSIKFLARPSPVLREKVTLVTESSLKVD